MFFYCKVCTKRRLCDWGNLRDVRWALTYRRGLSSCLRSVSDQQSSTNVTPPGHQPINVHLKLHLNSKLTLTCTKSDYKQQLSSLALLGLMLILIGWRMLECDLSSLFLLYFQKKSWGEWLHMCTWHYDTFKASWEVVFKTSGAFKSLLSEQDGVVPILN